MEFCRWLAKFGPTFVKYELNVFAIAVLRFLSVCSRKNTINCFPRFFNVICYVLKQDSQCMLYVCFFKDGIIGRYIVKYSGDSIRVIVSVLYKLSLYRMDLSRHNVVQVGFLHLHFLI